jgi:hypothetical protein
MHSVIYLVLLWPAGESSGPTAFLCAGRDRLNGPHLDVCVCVCVCVYDMNWEGESISRQQQGKNKCHDRHTMCVLRTGAYIDTSLGTGPIGFLQMSSQ